MRHTILHSVCTHRRHLRLDNLRTLILADNQFTRIQLATDDDGDISSCTEDEDMDKVIFNVNNLHDCIQVLGKQIVYNY